MAAHGCKEVTAGSGIAEKLSRETDELKALLRNQPRYNETDREKIREWVAKMDETINRALCSLRLRGTNPDLEKVFIDFEELKDRAETAWIRIEGKLNPS